MIYLQLFATFFVIGLFTFGGGAAMLSLIQTQVVTKFGWLTEAQFTDIVAISQCTPGPIGVNCATYTGYEVAGVAGSVLATFALVLPSFIIFYGIITLYNKYHHTSLFSDVMTVQVILVVLVFLKCIFDPRFIKDPHRVCLHSLKMPQNGECVKPKQSNEISKKSKHKLFSFMKKS